MAKVRVSGVVLDVIQKQFGGKDGKQPFRFTEVSVFTEEAAALEPIRFLSDYNGSIPGKGELVDMLVETGAFAGRVDLTAVRPWPAAAKPVAAVPSPARSA